MLREHEAGATVSDLCSKHGMSWATFYAWKAKYGGMEVSDARRLKALEEENTKLKRLSSNTLLTFLDHAEHEALKPGQYVGERLVGLYETYSLDEALAAMELLLAHARSWRPDKQVERDEQHNILEEDEELPFFVYVLGDSILEFPGRSIAPG